MGEPDLLSVENSAPGQAERVRGWEDGAVRADRGGTAEDRPAAGPVRGAGPANSLNTISDEWCEDVADVRERRRFRRLFALTSMPIRGMSSVRLDATLLVAQQKPLRYSDHGMPVSLAHKVESLRDDFRSAARLAEMLGVSRSQVTRWLRGAGIDPLNAEKVDLLELVWSNVLRLYDREAALAWLFGLNPLLSDRRPIDLVRAGRAEELMRAIRAERADTFA